jgi:uncharacterized caspase-like protein
MRCLSLVFALLLLTLPAFAEKWALVVGIDDYKDRNHISALTGAARDARRFRTTLIEVMGVPEDHVQFLVADKTRDDEESLPTRSQILRALSRLKQSAKPGDTAFVYFSGHGVRVGTRDYLLPYDFEGIDAETGIDTALAEDLFYERLSQVQAEAIVLVWDKCRNDPFAKTRAGGPQRNTLTDSQASKSWKVVRTADTGPLPSLIKLFACAPGQCSYEWTDKGQGYFTYFLERGLRGAAADTKGRVTVKSLKDYLLKEVAARVQQNENAAQTPHATLDGTNPEDLVLAVAGKAVASAPAPKPSPARPTPKPDPVKSVPKPTPPAPFETLPWPQRALAAHRWDAYRKLPALRLSGTVKVTAPEPETMGSFTLTLMPSGSFRAGWTSEGDRQEAGGDTQRFWVKVNGQTVFSPPDENLKPTIFPQGILQTVLKALDESPQSWKPASGESGPALMAIEEEGGVRITTVALFDPQTARLKRLKMSVGALGVVTHRYQIDVTAYRDVQGVPIPSGLSLELTADGTTGKTVHTYTKIEPISAPSPGFFEG